MSTAMIAALAAAVIGVVGAEASGEGCVEGGSFRYCGEHLPLSRLPFTFKMNHAGRPSSISSGEAARATRDGVDTWNAAWPKAMLTRNGARIDVGVCGPLCYGGTVSSNAGVNDGVNVIGWGDPATCDGHHAERIAVACLWYEDSAHTRIREVDIILNIEKRWEVADATSDPVIGELHGSIPVRVGDSAWYDLQSVITHELGHALGLEDIGDEVRKWPGNFEDMHKHQQTMYRWYIQGSTNKRTLGEGDIIGLSLAAWDTAMDA